MRKLLLATVAALSVIPAVLAQEAIKGVTLENILGIVVKSLCPSGSAFACPFLDFIISFGVVAAVFYMGLNTVEVFSGNASAQRASALIAILAGLSTAFYIWTQKIAFVVLVCSFALFFVVLFFLLVIVNFVASRGRHTWSSRLFWLGIILIAGGTLAIYFRQTSMGPMAMIIGFFLAVLGGIWAVIRHLEGRGGGGGGGGFLGGPAPTPTPTPGLGAARESRLWDAFRESKEIERIVKKEFRDLSSETKINNEFKRLLNHITRELVAIRESISANPPVWAYAQSSVNGIKADLVRVRDILNAEKAKTQAVITRAKDALSRADAEEREDTTALDNLLKDAIKRFELIEQQIEKINEWETWLINEEYANLEALATALANKKFYDANVLIQKIYESLEKAEMPEHIEDKDLAELVKLLEAMLNESHDAELAMRWQRAAVQGMEFIRQELESAQRLVADAKATLTSSGVQYPQAIAQTETALAEITSALNLIKNAEGAGPNAAFTEIKKAIAQIEIAIREATNVEHIPVGGTTVKEKKFDAGAIKDMQEALGEAEKMLADEKNAFKDMQHS